MWKVGLLRCSSSLSKRSISTARSLKPSNQFRTLTMRIFGII
ncbi:Uncharacterised protein [Vibrio cholerae]|nr:Uncharacterised protein [Vibrio cholerae]